MNILKETEELNKFIVHRYRKNGISQLQEAESYEAERIKRNKKKADRKKALEAGLPEPPSAEPSPVK